MLLFADSFDHYATAQIGQKYFAIGSGPTIESTGARTGAGCLQITAAFGPTALLPSQPGTIYFGTALYVNTLATVFPGPCVSFRDEGASGDKDQCQVGVGLDGSIIVWRGTQFAILGSTAPGLVVPGVYSYIEVFVVISTTVGKVTVRVNGVTVITLTGLNNQVTVNPYISGVQLMSVGGAGAWRHDDVYICDSLGGVNDGFLGPVKIYLGTSVSDSAPIDWTPSTGATHFDLVDEVPPNTTDYVSSGVVNTQDQYLYDAPTIPAFSLVLGIQHVLYAALDIAGAHSVGSCLDGVDGPGTALSTSYLFVKQPYDGPFTLADVTTKAWGPVVTA